MEIMSSLPVNPDYEALLARFPLRVIRSEQQNEIYIKALYELEQHQDCWSAEEADLADLFTLLIEDYEDKHYQLPNASPLEVLRFLMEQQSFEQKDLTAFFGTPSIVSELMNGKRELNKEQIRRLSRHFHVSPELFF